MRIGYARVSTNLQDRALQLDALHAAGCGVVREETASGKSVRSRPVITEVLTCLRKGDELVVWRLDRLGRSLRDLLDIIEVIHKAGANLVSLHERIDTTSATGRLTFQIAGAFAEFERGMIQERTLAGLTAARARGREGGRPSKEKRAAAAVAECEGNRELLIRDVCERYKISHTTFYKYKNALDAARQEAAIEPPRVLKSMRPAKKELHHEPSPAKRGVRRNAHRPTRSATA